jgi:hypothetical protein
MGAGGSVPTADDDAPAEGAAAAPWSAEPASLAFWELPSEDICSYLWRYDKEARGGRQAQQPTRCVFEASAATQILQWCPAERLEHGGADADAPPPAAVPCGELIGRAKSSGWVDLATVVGVEAVEAAQYPYLLRLRLSSSSSSSSSSSLSSGGGGGGAGREVLLQAGSEEERRDWLLRLPRLALTAAASRGDALLGGGGGGRYSDGSSTSGVEERRALLDLALLGSAALGQAREVSEILAWMRRGAGATAHTGEVGGMRTALVAAAQTGAYDAFAVLLTRLTEEEAAVGGRGGGGGRGAMVLSQSKAALGDALAVASAFDRLDCIEALLATSGTSAAALSGGAVAAAAGAGRLEALELLLAPGFEAAARDPAAGQVAAAAAEAQGFPECASLLRMHLQAVPPSQQRLQQARGGGGRHAGAAAGGAWGGARVAAGAAAAEYGDGGSGRRRKHRRQHRQQQQQQARGGGGGDEVDPERVQAVVMAFLEALMNPRPRMSKRERQRQREEEERQAAAWAAWKPPPPPPPSATIDWLLDRDSAGGYRPGGHAGLARRTCGAGLQAAWVQSGGGAGAGAGGGGELESWMEVIDEGSGTPYYVELGSGHTQWGAPEGQPFAPAEGGGAGAGDIGSWFDEFVADRKTAKGFGGGGGGGGAKETGGVVDEEGHAWETAWDEGAEWWYYVCDATGETVWAEETEEETGEAGTEYLALGSGEWQQHVDGESGALYWHNEATGESRWEEASEDWGSEQHEGAGTEYLALGSGEWQQHVDDESGAQYWHNDATGESRWDEDEAGEGRDGVEHKDEVAAEAAYEAAWESCVDEESGAAYWFNAVTHESVWQEAAEAKEGSEAKDASEDEADEESKT